MPHFDALRSALRTEIARLFARMALMACAVTTGCHSTVQETTGPVAGVAIAGSLHSGQQPVTGASVQLYAAGTLGDGSAATALLTPPVATESFGGFNITAKYTCPSASTEVYLVASGGNPGAGGSTNNLALSEMAALGPAARCPPATSATLFGLFGLGTDNAGNLLLTDYARIRRVTFASPPGFSGAAGTSANEQSVGEFRDPQVPTIPARF